MARERSSEIMAQLAEVTVARCQVVDARISLEQQLSEASSVIVKAQIADRIALCRQHLGERDGMLVDLVQADPATVRRFDILTSANMSEVAALAGLAPMNREPGLLRGRKTIRGGRVAARNVIYRAATVAMRWTRDLAAFYGRVLLTGKTFKVAIAATGRKLIVLANTLLKEDRMWTPAPP